ncbi:RrF2 family transcriptional regulator [Klebsiella aerogenes]|uniref:Rrf2 family transcriptional regulator n=1 Tax=Klebsiella aerogenes TaxID=548 RepID=A0AAP9R280_KLEAE|nr:Rrf2 family transcriptional regulator [Klebsiella aerogenes]QMR43122.1 Rrf2 family transcriptional regulator [Klebsiella aerogenes]
MMNFKIRSAIKILTILYQQGSDKPVSLSSLSRIAGISLSYTENIFQYFRKAGLVFSTMGRCGGYMPAHPDISVADVILAIKMMPEEPFFEPIYNALSKMKIRHLARQDELSMFSKDRN